MPRTIKNTARVVGVVMKSFIESGRAVHFTGALLARSRIPSFPDDAECISAKRAAHCAVIKGTDCPDPLNASTASAGDLKSVLARLLWKAWHATRRLTTSLLSLLVVTALVAGCHSDGNDSGAGGAGQVVATGTVSGKVVSAATGDPVAGATVSTAAGSTTTAADGSFIVVAGSGERTVIHVDAAGFAEAFPVANVGTGQQTNLLSVKLLVTAVSAQVAVASGGTVSDPNSSAQVTIPPDGLVPEGGGTAAGTVTIAITPVNPAVDVSLMPGDFMAASAGGGSPVPIESFGALLVDIRDSSGTQYNLAAGNTSTIRIPLGTNSASPPATIPLFFFDETTGLWTEEGAATLQGTAPNQYYEGTVTHFSYWNADQVMNTVFVTGCLEDSNGQPVPNALVSTIGSDYTGASVVRTAADGAFRVAMRRAGVATLSVVDLDGTPLINPISVGPFDTDTTLPACLESLQLGFRITTPSLPAGLVNANYETVLTAAGGTLPYSWSATGPLSEGLILNASTGAISGTPTTAGTATVTIQVQDGSSPPQLATKQFAFTILPPFTGGDGRTLSLTGAPASAEGAFTAYSRSDATNTDLTSGPVELIVWAEALALPPYPHTETLSVVLDGQTGQVISVSMSISEFDSQGIPTEISNWFCVGGPACNGVVVDKASGTVNFSGTALTSAAPTPAPSITLNGTLTFKSELLALTGAPSATAGDLVTNSQFASVNGNVLTLSWIDQPVLNAPNIEFLDVVFDLQTGQIVSAFYVFKEGSIPSISWECAQVDDDDLACSGITVNRTTGIVTFAGTVLASNDGLPPITLNGTLSFTPF
jgi:hypothetical protein